MLIIFNGMFKFRLLFNNLSVCIYVCMYVCTYCFDMAITDTSCWIATKFCVVMGLANKHFFPAFGKL